MPNSVGLRHRFVKSAMDAPFLGREEEHDLAVRWRENRDQVAMHQMARSHMRLVIAIALRFRHYGLPMPDLIQEGHVGLLEAASRFEPEREVRFSTYATWWIRASIQDYILRNWSIVRGGTSSAQKALFFNLRRLRAKISQRREEGGLEALYSEIASAIGVSVKDVAVMDSRLSAPDTSLSAPLIESDSEGATSREMMLVDDRPLQDETVEETIDGERRVLWLQSALDVLTDRELRIVRARRLNEETDTLEMLGERMGISKERVRQIECRALEKLRHTLLDRHPDAAAAFM